MQIYIFFSNCAQQSEKRCRKKHPLRRRPEGRGVLSDRFSKNRKSLLSDFLAEIEAEPLGGRERRNTAKFQYVHL